MPRIKRSGKFGFFIYLRRPYRDVWFAFSPDEWRFLRAETRLSRLTRVGPFSYWTINTRFAGSR